MSTTPDHPAAVRLAEQLRPWYDIHRTPADIRLHCRRCHVRWGILRTAAPSLQTAKLLITHTLSHDPSAPVPPTTEFP